MKPKLKKQLDYYPIDHKKAIEILPADKFVNFMAITNSYGNKQVCAVYYTSSPNLTLGHKSYPMLTCVKDEIFILARNHHELLEDSIHCGVLCKSCNTVLVSLDRHNYHTCGCPNETMIDGGQEYLRYGGKDLTKVKQVRVDMLNNKYKVVNAK